MLNWLIQYASFTPKTIRFYFRIQYAAKFSEKYSKAFIEFFYLIVLPYLNFNFRYESDLEAPWQIDMAIGVTMEAVYNMQERKEGGVYSEEAVKNAQEGDNAALSAVIDVGEIYSEDEVLVATAVKEEDSNIWVSSNGRSVELVVLTAVGQVVAGGKQRMLWTCLVQGVGESALSVTR